MNIDGFAAFTGEGKGVVHVLVADEGLETLRNALTNAGMPVADEREVFVVSVADEPGALGEVARRLAGANVNIDLAYTTFGGVRLVPCLPATARPPGCDRLLSGRAAGCFVRRRPTRRACRLAASGVERLASTAHVVGAEHQAYAAEGRVGQVDVHVGAGEPTSHLTEGAGLVRDADHEDLTLVGDGHTGVGERVPQGLESLVGDEYVHDALALAREGGEAVDVHAGGARYLTESRELARPVIEDHRHVVGHHPDGAPRGPGSRGR